MVDHSRVAKVFFLDEPVAQGLECIETPGNASVSAQHASCSLPLVMLLILLVTSPTFGLMTNMWRSGHDEEVFVPGAASFI